jgi:hypothetical protein
MSFPQKISDGMFSVTKPVQQLNTEQQRQICTNKNMGMVSPQQAAPLARGPLADYSTPQSKQSVPPHGSLSTDGNHCAFTMDEISETAVGRLPGLSDANAAEVRSLIWQMSEKGKQINEKIRKLNSEAHGMQELEAIENACDSCSNATDEGINGISPRISHYLFILDGIRRDAREFQRLVAQYVDIFEVSVSAVNDPGFMFAAISTSFGLFKIMSLSVELCNKYTAETESICDKNRIYSSELVAIKGRRAQEEADHQKTLNEVFYTLSAFIQGNNSSVMFNYYCASLVVILEDTIAKKTLSGNSKMFLKEMDSSCAKYMDYANDRWKHGDRATKDRLKRFSSMSTVVLYFEILARQGYEKGRQEIFTASANANKRLASEAAAKPPARPPARYVDNRSNECCVIL